MDCIVAVLVEEQRPDFANLQRSGATEGVVYRRSRPRRFTSETSSYMI